MSRARRSQWVGLGAPFSAEPFVKPFEKWAWGAAAPQPSARPRQSGRRLGRPAWPSFLPVLPREAVFQRRRQGGAKPGRRLGRRGRPRAPSPRALKKNPGNLPCPSRRRSCFRGAALVLWAMTASIRGFSGKAKSTPSRRHRPIRQDAIGCQACNGLCAWGRSEAGRTPEQPAGAACASKPQGSRRFVVETALPPTLFFISARATARVRLRNRWRPGHSPCSLSHADAIRRSGVGRNPSIANHSKFGCWSAVSHPRVRASFAPTPNARAFPSPWLHGGMRQAALRNSNDGLIDPRRFRPLPPAFRSGGAEKNRLGPNLGQPPPPSQPTLRGPAHRRR